MTVFAVLHIIVGLSGAQWPLPQRHRQCISRIRDRSRIFDVVARGESYPQVVRGDQVGTHNSDIADIRQRPGSRADGHRPNGRPTDGAVYDNDEA